jgi:hypothetical protein
MSWLNMNLNEIIGIVLVSAVGVLFIGGLVWLLSPSKNN